MQLPNICFGQNFVDRLIIGRFEQALYRSNVDYVAEDFMATFREIDMSIHSLLDSQPVEKVETTAEEILEKYKQSEAEEAESKGGSGNIFS